MRANLFEKLLNLMIKNKDNPQALSCYLTKAEILLSRKNDESVIRELINQ